MSGEPSLDILNNEDFSKPTELNLDLDGDGVVEEEEIKEVFDRIDTNDDGVIDEEEAKAAEEAAKAAAATAAGAAPGAAPAAGTPTPAAGKAATPTPAAPAKRDSVVHRNDRDRAVRVEYADGSYLTIGANGKRYKKEQFDGRDTEGPRKRHLSSLGGTYGNNSTRNLFGFGYVSNDRLAKGIAESKDTNYNDSAEEKLNKLDQDIKDIMEE